MSEDKEKVTGAKAEEEPTKEKFAEEDLNKASGGWNPILEKDERQYPIVPDLGKDYR